MKKILLLLAVVSVFAIGASFMFITKIDKIDIGGHNLYQYLSNQRYVYTGDVQLSRKDDKTTLYNNGKKFEMDSDPIYYANENKILLPKDMVLVSYEDGAVKKFLHFNTIFTKDHKIYAKIDNKEVELKSCFLFDGDDTYIFLDDVKIKYGDITYNMSPLSYVTFSGGSNLSLYLKDINEYKKENITNETVQITSNYGYTVNLNSDSLTYNNNGVKQLLPKGFDGLTNFE